MKDDVGRVPASSLVPPLPTVLPSAGIPVHKLDLAATQGTGGVRVQEVLAGEIKEVRTHFVSVVGPAAHIEPASLDREVVWLFVDGKGTLRAKDKTYDIHGETIARAPLGWSWTIEVSEGEVLHAIKVQKSLSEDDFAQLKKFPEHNAVPYVKSFSECPTYGESIKSAKTVSRTLLPENYVPRMAIGSVETEGPDMVGAHRHPMLEQFFLSLKDNEITVFADDDKVTLSPFSLLHIPLGSNHGVEVARGKKLHYVWIDFFVTKEGQEWLKTHKHTNNQLQKPVAT